MKDMRFTFTCIFPCSYEGIFFIVSQSLPIRSLIFFPEMSTARFISVKRISNKKFTKLKKVSNPAGFFKFLIKLSKLPGDLQVLPELIPEIFYKHKCFFQSFFASNHSTMVPHNLT